jgi:hypothetical protein
MTKNREELTNHIFTKKDFLIDDLYYFCDLNKIDAVLISEVLEKLLSKGDIIELKKDFYKIV